MIGNLNTELYQPKPGQSYLFDGDSGTNRRLRPTFSHWPYLQMMNWDCTWADEFSKMLLCWRPELATRFQNAAVGGSKSYEILERFDEFVLPTKPDWVMLTMGGNDVAIQLPIEDTCKNMSEYIDRVQRECEGNVVVVGGFLPCPHCSQMKVDQVEIRNERQRVIRKVCGEKGAIFIDVGPVLKKKAEALYEQCEIHTVYSDGGHYNSVGSTIIAMEVMKSLSLI